jgi:hypothetical protein
MYNIEEMAKIAYDNYCHYTQGISLVTGEKLPNWDDLPDNIKRAWRGSMLSVIDYIGLTNATI